ncbi:hypothetical protein Gogos_004626 [Gossypium gossypioides]|uniref:Uncharacterized protein n=1 Tax=Gossypium gossypioides TaxID=34282 RepID=A0A7J9CH06_GOSGO|nr:hypothetical protein [Gossypium gossypioides]
MPLKKHSRVDASSSNPHSSQNDSLNDCFQNTEERTCFYTYFSTHKVNISRPLDLETLADFNFAYLPALGNWHWIDFLKIHSPTHANLVRAFYSNALLEHDSSVLIPYDILVTPRTLVLIHGSKVLNPNPIIEEDEDVEGSDLIPHLEQAPPLATPFSTETNALLSTINSLSNEFRGFRGVVSDEFQGLGARMTTLEEHMAYIMSPFPPP